MPLHHQMSGAHGEDRDRTGPLRGCAVALLGTTTALAACLGLIYVGRPSAVSAGTTTFIVLASIAFGLFAAARYRFWIHRLQRHDDGPGKQP